MPCSLYFEPDRCDVNWSEPTAVRVDGLLARLIAHLTQSTLADDQRLRAEAVVLDLLQPLPATPIDVPRPVDGQPVFRVAHTVGYATASAFLAAFRRTVGTSPRRYLDG